MVWTEETFQLVRDGIDAARLCRTSILSEKWDKLVEERSLLIDLPANEATSIDIVIFHVVQTEIILIAYHKISRRIFI